MKVLTHLMMIESVRRWLLVLVLGTGLVLLGEFMGELGFYLSVLSSRRWWLCALYFLCQVPAFLQTWLPLSVLVAAMFTAGPMLRQGTLMALAAAGIPASRIFRPFLVLGCVAGVFSVILADQAVPRCEPISEALRSRMKYRGFDLVPARVAGWVSGGDQWMSAQAFPADGKYYRVVIFDRAGQRIVSANTLLWTEAGWRLEDVDVLIGERLTRFPTVAPAALGLTLDEDREALAERLRPDSSRTLAELHRTESPRFLAIFCQRLAAILVPILCLAYGLPRFVRWESRGKLAVPALQAVAFALIPIMGLAIMGRLIIATGHRVELIALGMVGCLLAMGWLRWRRLRL